MFTVTLDVTLDVFDNVVVPSFTVNVLRRFPDTPRVPFETVAPLTLPAIVAVPVVALIVNVLLSIPPLATVKLPLPLTRVANATLPPDVIVATEFSFNVRLLPRRPLNTRLELPFKPVDPTTVPVTPITALLLPARVPPTRPVTFS